MHVCGTGHHDCLVLFGARAPVTKRKGRVDSPKGERVHEQGVGRIAVSEIMEVLHGTALDDLVQMFSEYTGIHAKVVPEYLNCSGGEVVHDEVPHGNLARASGASENLGMSFERLSIGAIDIMPVYDVVFPCQKLADHDALATCVARRGSGS